MNTRMLLAIGLLTFPLVSAKADPQINVSGSAEVKVAPDEVDLNVGVETRDENLETAKQNNDARVSAALDFLKHQGVKDKDVQTDYVTIEPIYDANAVTASRPGWPSLGFGQKGSSTKPVFYLVHKNIGIKLTDVGNFDTVLTGLITNGVNVVQGIDFRTTELRKYKDEARAMAIKAAKEKAEAMASELGVKVGKPCSISVNDGGGWFGWAPSGWGYGGSGANAIQNVTQNAGGSDENGPTFAVGEISVSANVSVSFLIE